MEEKVNPDIQEEIAKAVRAEFKKTKVEKNGKMKPLTAYQFNQMVNLAPTHPGILKILRKEYTGNVMQTNMENYMKALGLEWTLTITKKEK